MENMLDQQNKLPEGAMNLIFWGLIIDFFDFRISHFDILPDIVGAAIIILGLSRLIGVNEYFRKSRNVSIATLPFAFLDTFEISVPGEQTMTIYVAGLGVALGLIATYYLCKGIAEAAKTVENSELSHIVMTHYSVYLVSTVFSFVLSLILPSFAIFVMVVAVISYIILLHLIYKARETL